MSMGKLQIRGDDGNQPNTNQAIPRLLAYRDLSRVASLTIPPDSPSVAALLDQLSRPKNLTQLEPLCGEWLAWRGRKTDGMLLIGRLVNDGDAESMLELSDGTQFRVRLADDLELPVDARCACLGKLLSTDDVPLVHLVAGIVVD